MLKYEELTGKIIGAFYNELGHGFLETVYEKAMLVALKSEGFGVEEQKAIPVRFRGLQIGCFFADLVVNELIVLELKTARAIDRVHEAQLLHYLKASDMEVGVLLNFGDRPQFRRLLLDNEHKKLRGAPLEPIAENPQREICENPS